MKILVVDDEPEVLKVLGMLVQAICTDCEVETALGGPRAIALLGAQTRDNLYDIVITDHDMPGANGLCVCREAKGLRHHVTVIMVSGLMNEWLHDEAIGSGVTHCLSKPVSAEDLRRVLPSQMVTS